MQRYVMLRYPTNSRPGDQLEVIFEAQTKSYWLIPRRDPKLRTAQDGSHIIFVPDSSQTYRASDVVDGLVVIVPHRQYRGGAFVSRGCCECGCCFIALLGSLFSVFTLFIPVQNTWVAETTPTISGDRINASALESYPPTGEPTVFADASTVLDSPSAVPTVLPNSTTSAPILAEETPCDLRSSSDIAFFMLLAVCVLGVCVFGLPCMARSCRVSDYRSSVGSGKFRCFVDWDGRPLADQKNGYPGTDRSPDDEVSRSAARSHIIWSLLLFPFILIVQVCNNLLKSISTMLLLLLSIGHVDNRFDEKFSAVFTALFRIVGEVVVPVLRIGLPELDVECFAKWGLNIMNKILNLMDFPVWIRNLFGAVDVTCDGSKLPGWVAS